MKSWYDNISQLRAIDRVLIVLCMAMVFLFPLAHIMALKKVVLYFAFILAFQSAYLALKQKNNLLLLVFVTLLALQLWMLMIAGAIADDSLASLMEWKGQWIPSVLCFVLGVSLAYLLHSRFHFENRKLISMIVFIPTVAYLLINSGYVLTQMIEKGRFLTQLTGISDHKANISYLISVFEPILIADILLRISRREALLPLPAWIPGCVLLLIIFSLVSAGSRSGILIMMLAFMIGGVLTLKEVWWTHSSRKAAQTATVFVLFITVFTTIAYISDPRWKLFVETVPIAWDIDQHQAWKTGDLSTLAIYPHDGEIEESAYLRIAWVHEGLRLLVAHPWGTELSRDTFYRLETEAYGQVMGMHSHNGWIDLGLNVGFPGLILWALFLFLQGWAGWKAWNKRNDAIGLALTILVIMFSIRALFDSTFRDHIIQQFMLVAGLLFSTLCFAQQDTRNNEPSTKP